MQKNFSTVSPETLRQILSDLQKRKQELALKLRTVEQELKSWKAYKLNGASTKSSSKKKPKHKKNGPIKFPGLQAIVNKNFAQRDSVTIDEVHKLLTQKFGHQEGLNKKKLNASFYAIMNAGGFRMRRTDAGKRYYQRVENQRAAVNA